MASVVRYFVGVSPSDAETRALVADPAEVARISAALAGAPLACFDLEFLSADRLVPALCLLQVAWSDMGPDVVPELALVDPQAVDVAPLVAALGAHPRVVVHAGRQDLQLLATRFGARFPGIIDTQVMAAFAGLGDQVGLATLAGELVGATIGKDQQWTDWSRRPLSTAQLLYAAADVRWLPAMYARLAARLGERLPWAKAESEVVAADAIAASEVTPETAWQNVGTRGLDAAGIATVKTLAAWRQRTAMELDRPLGHILNEKQLLELARARPDEPEDVRRIKGLPQPARQRASEILEAIAAADPSTVDASPRLHRPPSPRAQRWSELLLIIVQLVADRTGVAARLLATRSDADDFARAVDEQGPTAAESLPALSTWRRAVLGHVWLDFIAGKLALVGDASTPTGVALKSG